MSYHIPEFVSEQLRLLKPDDGTTEEDRDAEHEKFMKTIRELPFPKFEQALSEKHKIDRESRHAGIEFFWTGINDIWKSYVRWSKEANINISKLTKFEFSDLLDQELGGKSRNSSRGKIFPVRHIYD